MTKNGSIREMLKTGAICTMVGAVGGGVATYHAENLESREHFHETYQQVRELQRQVFEAQNGCYPGLDSLNRLYLHYKLRSDSLQQELLRVNALLDGKQDSLNGLKNWAEEASDSLEQNKVNLGLFVTAKASLENALGHVRDSLEGCENRDDRNQRILEQNNRNIEACKEEQQRLSSSLSTLKQSLATEEREVRIRDNQLDSLESILEKYKNRYDIETEYSMLTLCVYGHGNTMSRIQYERQSKCCVKRIRQLQKSYPTERDLKKINENFEMKNLCDVDNFYDD